MDNWIQNRLLNSLWPDKGQVKVVHKNLCLNRFQLVRLKFYLNSSPYAVNVGVGKRLSSQLLPVVNAEGKTIQNRLERQSLSYITIYGLILRKEAKYQHTVTRISIKLK